MERCLSSFAAKASSVQADLGISSCGENMVIMRTATWETPTYEAAKKAENGTSAKELSKSRLLKVKFLVVGERVYNLCKRLKSWEIKAYGSEKQYRPILIETTNEP